MNFSSTQSSLLGNSTGKDFCVDLLGSQHITSVGCRLTVSGGGFSIAWVSFLLGCLLTVGYVFSRAPS
jgi:hypothetical protein